MLYAPASPFLIVHWQAGTSRGRVPSHCGCSECKPAVVLPRYCCLRLTPFCIRTTLNVGGIWPVPMFVQRDARFISPIPLEAVICKVAQVDAGLSAFYCVPMLEVTNLTCKPTALT